MAGMTSYIGRHRAGRIGAEHRVADGGLTTWLRRCGAMLGALLLATTVVSIGLAPSAAGASVTFFGVDDSRGNHAQGFYQFRLDGQTVNFMCTDSGHAPPDPGRVSYRLDTLAGAWNVSYLLAKYGTTTNKNRAAALNYIVRNSDEIPHHHLSDPTTSSGYSSMKTAMKYVRDMLAEAQKNRGPYRLTATLSFRGSEIVARTVIRSKEGSGVPQGGVPITLTLQGGTAQFDDNKQTSITVTSSATGEVSAPVTVLAAGDITLKATSGPLPDGTVELVLPGNATADKHDSKTNYQRGITHRYGTAPLAAVSRGTIPSFAVSVTTQTSDAEPEPGTKLTDTQVLSVRDGQWRPGEKVKVTTTLYGPLSSAPTETASPPADAPVAGVVSYLASKPGTYVTPAVTVTAAGYYVWRAVVQAGPFNEGFSGRFGEASETSLIRWDPRVVTQVQKSSVLPGDTLRDEIFLSNGRPGHSYEVVSTLWGPLSEPPAVDKPVPQSTPRADSVTTTITAGKDGTGSATSPGTVLDKAGYYVYTETIAAQAGSAEWIGDLVRAEETSLATWQVQVVTEVQQARTEVGAAMRDHLLVTSGQPHATYLVESTLWGPFSEQPVVGEQIPEGAPVLDQIATQVTVDADGEGSAWSDETVLPLPGYYVYTESIAQSETTSGWSQTVVRAEETTLAAWEPTVSTRVSHEVRHAGDTVYDTLDVVGVPPAPVAVDVVLYYTPTPWANDLNEPPQDAAQVESWTVQIDGPGSYRTPEFEVPDQPGVYTFYATVPEDALVQEFRPPTFPEPSETFVVPYQPSVLTQAQLVDGADFMLADHIAVSGGMPHATVQVESTLWGPFLDQVPHIPHPAGNTAPRGEDCQPTLRPGGGDGAAGPHALVTTEVRLDETGAGTAVTEAVEVLEPGFYVWTETIAGNEFAGCWASDFGLVAETALTRWQPVIQTRAHTEQTADGVLVYDEVTISGLPPNHARQPAVWDAADQMPPATPPEQWDETSGHGEIHPGAHPTDAATVTVALWGPLPTQPEPGAPIPDEAPQVGQTDLPAVNGTQNTVVMGPLTEPGWYVFTVQWPETLRVMGGMTPAELSETVRVDESIQVAAEVSGLVQEDGVAGSNEPPPNAQETAGLAATGTPRWTLPATVLALLTLGGGIALLYTERRRRRAPHDDIH